MSSAKQTKNVRGYVRDSDEAINASDINAVQGGAVVVWYQRPDFLISCEWCGE